MTARDDAVRAAVAPLLDELRAEFLVMPREQVVEQHLDMMTFERQVLDAPRPTRAPQRQRRPVTSRPRRTAFVLACVTATVASCGLSAAGALPEPLQHITDSIAHTLGVPEPHDTTTGSPSGAGAAASPTTPPVSHPGNASPSPTRPASPATSSTPTTTKPHPSAHRSTVHPTTPPATTVTPAAGPPAFPARPTKGPHRIDPKPQQKPPSKNSENTPPGYPTDWRDRAIGTAASGLWDCTQVTVLDPPACPQSVTASGTIENVQWALLNDAPLSAAAVAHTTRAADGTTHTIVTVYERFQMEVMYTADGNQKLGYSSGVAQATMTFNGSSFDHVTFTDGSVAGHVERGVSVPGLVRPAGAVDVAVLGALHDVFVACTAPSSGGDCPPGGVLDTPTAAQSTLTSDPTSGATVRFDPRTGLLVVTGTYSMVTSTGSPVTGSYTASLFFDNLALRTLSVV
jgi:hypothetical protein